MEGRRVETSEDSIKNAVTIRAVFEISETVVPVERVLEANGTVNFPQHSFRIPFSFSVGWNIAKGDPTGR